MKCLLKRSVQENSQQKERKGALLNLGGTSMTPTFLLSPALSVTADIAPYEMLTLEEAPGTGKWNS